MSKHRLGARGGRAGLIRLSKWAFLSRKRRLRRPIPTLALLSGLEEFLQRCASRDGLVPAARYVRASWALKAIFYSSAQFTAKYPGFNKSESVVKLSLPSSDGANFVFQFASTSGVTYSAQRSTSLGSGSWRTILTDTAIPINGVITVSVPVKAENAAFYRMYTLRLVNPSRTGSEFRFQFYAENGTRYLITRKTSLSDGSWIPVLSIEGTGALTIAIDPSATSPTAYYRVEY